MLRLVKLPLSAEAPNTTKPRVCEALWKRTTGFEPATFGLGSRYIQDDG